MYSIFWCVLLIGFKNFAGDTLDINRFNKYFPMYMALSENRVNLRLRRYSSNPVLNKIGARLHYENIKEKYPALEKLDKTEFSEETFCEKNCFCCLPLESQRSSIIGKKVANIIDEETKKKIDLAKKNN
ncbi:MAG: hypothetical protein ACXWL5_04035 [Candidatus Chromulinivorax sp.]